MRCAPAGSAKISSPAPAAPAGERQGNRRAAPRQADAHHRTPRVRDDQNGASRAPRESGGRRQGSGHFAQGPVLEAPTPGAVTTGNPEGSPDTPQSAAAPRSIPARSD